MNQKLTVLQHGPNLQAALVGPRQLCDDNRCARGALQAGLDEVGQEPVWQCTHHISSPQVRAEVRQGHCLHVHASTMLAAVQASMTAGVSRRTQVAGWQHDGGERALVGQQGLREREQEALERIGDHVRGGACAACPAHGQVMWAPFARLSRPALHAAMLAEAAWRLRGAPVGDGTGACCSTAAERPAGGSTAGLHR